MAKKDNENQEKKMTTPEDELVNEENSNKGEEQESPEKDFKADESLNKKDENKAGKEVPSEESGENKKKTPEQRIADLEEEVLSLKDKLLRKQADYENFRKRLFKEKEDSVKYANQMLLLDITSVIDDFERAIKSAEESKDFNAFHDGIVLIEKRLVSTLEKKWELKRFNSVGEPFNPDKHLAIAVEEGEEHEVPTVIEDYQKGYLFHERVLRPAKVKVSQPKTKEENNSDINNQEQDKE